VSDNVIHDLALRKLSRVLGAEQARAIMDRALVVLGKKKLDSADDLHRFAQLLIKEKGFASAVGGILSVDAVMLGAKPEDE
jgi:hypothetical protein